MNAENLLAGTASLFLALGDTTRLRLLNLMRDREICVSSFTGTLGQSQPLISRHLAYLRNSGLVEARRDGKWIHYSISNKLDPNTSRLLVELFHWMEGQEGLQQDRERYIEVHPSAGCGRTSAPTATVTSRATHGVRIVDEPLPETHPTHQAESIDELELEIEFATDEDLDPAPTDIDRSPRHNEIEDFLL
jgi:ArsR family transcriptional regulator, arsenate/arsenite/antimonite-responsive transcriptional repressor